nr:uncharacterized protein LOC126533760 [Dermacentor andersoni]
MMKLFSCFLILVVYANIVHAQHTKTIQAPIQPELCTKPWDRGPCGANVSNWFHDNKYHECKVFNYGGCRGNGNRFWTEKKCLERCEPPERRRLVCSADPEPKPCKGILKWWFYSPGDKTCHRLPAGLCPSSPNKFLLCEKCMRRCSVIDARESCNREYKRMEEEEKAAKQGLTPTLVAGPAGSPLGLPLPGSGLTGETPITVGAVGSPNEINVPPLGPAAPVTSIPGSLPALVAPPHQTAGPTQGHPAILPAIPGSTFGAPEPVPGPHSTESGTHNPVIIVALINHEKNEAEPGEAINKIGMTGQSGDVTNDGNGIKQQAPSLPVPK